MRESYGRFLFEGRGFDTLSVQAALAKAGFVQVSLATMRSMDV